MFKQLNISSITHFTQSRKYYLIFAALFFPLLSPADPYLTLQNQIANQNPWLSDLWWPLYNTNQSFFFGDLSGAYSSQKNNSNVNVGAAYRNEYRPDWAWGGYLYASYNRSPQSQNFWTMNPGAELLNDRWHFSWNAYLPVSSTSQATGPTSWADDVGIYDYVSFQQHNQYDRLVQQQDRTGVGTDLVVSYRFARLANTQLSVGSYYFNMPQHPLGFTAGIATPDLNHFSLEADYSHDQLTHSTFSLGISLHFGGNAITTSQWIHEPIQHNIATLGQANSIPITNVTEPVSGSLLERDNIWFFDSAAPAFNAAQGAANCTYEHPCSGLNSETTFSISQLSHNSSSQDTPSLYLKSGTYQASSNPLYLFGNESLIGRSSNYVQDAAGNARPILQLNNLDINGNFGNQNNTVANLQFQNVGEPGAAIIAYHTHALNLNNLTIGTMNSTNPASNYNNGLLLDNANVNLTNSTINVNNYRVGTAQAINGILLLNENNLTVSNSTINAAVNNANLDVVGINVGDDSNLTINNSQINVASTGSMDSASFGIFLYPGTTNNLNINNTQLTVNSNGTNDIVNDLQLLGNSVANIQNSVITANVVDAGTTLDNQVFLVGDHAQLNLSNSVVTGTAQSNVGAAAVSDFGLLGNSITHITNSNVTAQGSSASVTGNTNLTTSDNAQAFITGSTLRVAMAGGPAPAGHEPSGAVALWSLGNSKISLNNSIVTATAGNNETGAVALQAQGNSQDTINNSVLSVFSNYGNVINTASATAVIAGNNSVVNIQNSLIYGQAKGIGDTQGSALVIGIDNANINISNSSLWLNNQSTTADGTPTISYGVMATSNSIIRLQNSGIHLSGSGGSLVPTKIFGDGQIIIS